MEEFIPHRAKAPMPTSCVVFERIKSAGRSVHPQKAEGPIDITADVRKTLWRRSQPANALV